MSDAPGGWAFKGAEEISKPPWGARRLHDTQPHTVVPWLIYSLLAVGKLRLGEAVCPLFSGSRNHDLEENQTADLSPNLIGDIFPFLSH